jgi:hypothetical protein
VPNGTRMYQKTSPPERENRIKKVLYEVASGNSAISK